VLPVVDALLTYLAEPETEERAKHAGAWLSKFFKDGSFVKGWRLFGEILLAPCRLAVASHGCSLADVGRHLSSRAQSTLAALHAGSSRSIPSQARRRRRPRSRSLLHRRPSVSLVSRLLQCHAFATVSPVFAMLVRRDSCEAQFLTCNLFSLAAVSGPQVVHTPVPPRKFDEQCAVLGPRGCLSSLTDHVIGKIITQGSATVDGREVTLDELTERALYFNVIPVDYTFDHPDELKPIVPGAEDADTPPRFFVLLAGFKRSYPSRAIPDLMHDDVCVFNLGWITKCTANAAGSVTFTLQTSPSSIKNDVTFPASFFTCGACAPLALLSLLSSTVFSTLPVRSSLQAGAGAGAVCAGKHVVSTKPSRRRTCSDRARSQSTR